MKRLFLALILMCSALYAEEFLIKTGNSFNMFTVDNINTNISCIFEIKPENKDVCKVYIGYTTIYLKRGDTLHLEYYLQDGRITAKDEQTVDKERILNKVLKEQGREPIYSDKLFVTDCKVVDFDYNKIITEIIKP